MKIARTIPPSLADVFVPKSLLNRKFLPRITYKTFLTMLRVQYLHTSCPLKVGMEPPNINILTIDGIQKKLLDFQNHGRPLVVNFGSCT